MAAYDNFSVMPSRMLTTLFLFLVKFRVAFQVKSFVLTGVAVNTTSIPLFSISPALSTYPVKPVVGDKLTGMIWSRLFSLYQLKSTPIRSNNFNSTPASTVEVRSGLQRRIACCIVPCPRQAGRLR